ncbi:MAG: TonB-dependent receptor [Bacteroidetes bacterium]|nr:TonB-dependent receptor [Bacteroidota bacterium]
MNRAIFLLITACSFSVGFAQTVTISGLVKDNNTAIAIPYVNVVVKNQKDSTFVAGTITDDEGRFRFTGIAQGHYYFEYSFVGFVTKRQTLFVGSLASFLDVGAIALTEDTKKLDEVVVVGQQDAVSEKLEKKIFSVADNLSQSGGSVMQAMQNLPGVTVQDGKVLLRGNDKVAVLIDGKQTALTGFGSQSGLDNLPASAIEKIEIINNPSAKYDANGNAGIINIIYKKNKQEGFNGKAGFALGAGALWVRQENLPTIRPQYQVTPKINPSLSLNYRKNKINAFFQGDYLYTETLNKNEFVTRNYGDTAIINQQTKRNRNTAFTTLKSGIDWTIDHANTLTISGLFGSEKIIDNGDEPFFNGKTGERLRLWQFLEDELKTTIMATAAYQHKFKEPGRLLNVGFNYTFHREDERYFFTNILPTFTGLDAFKLISDESVYDFNADYIRPLRYGRLETGVKFRKRQIPTNMLFIPGLNSPLDVNAGGIAVYNEVIPAAYGNYVFESEKIEAEVGLRFEYVKIDYEVDPNNPVYKTSGYDYNQPFPNMRFAYKFDDNRKVSLFFNRRVDRPNEVDIRVFPKYDDAEIIKVGNPALRPQFTNSVELGFKNNWAKGYFYGALYHRFADGTITRIASTVPGSTLIYAIFQNAGKSFNSGFEVTLDQEVTASYRVNINANVYHNQINAFSVENLYPQRSIFSAPLQEVTSWNLKINNFFKFGGKSEAQLTAIYLAPDIIPQGKIAGRFSLDVGVKRQIQKGKGELFLNATDLLNTLVMKKEVIGLGFKYTSTDYYETQVVRLGYNYKF